MNNIEGLLALSVCFEYPWLLFVLLPALAVLLIVHFLLPKKRRRYQRLSLALRSLILLFCTFLLAGMSFHFEDVRLKKEVIFLVDASDSTAARREDIDSFVRASLAGETEDHSIGIVTFANGSVSAAQLSSDFSDVLEAYTSNREMPKGDATDIAAALRFARSLLSNPEEGRIIVLSDGIQTDGDALSAVEELAGEGIKVDSVYFSPLPGGELLISSVTVPKRAFLGEEIAVEVDVASTISANAEVTLCADGEKEETRRVSLAEGPNHFSFVYTVEEAGLHEFCVTLASPDDTLSPNNTFYTYLDVSVAKKFLIADGTGKESQALVSALGEDYAAEVVAPADLPATAEELSLYDEVILLNVANSALPAGYGEVLTRYVEEFGGGLYTAGGENAYREEDMNGTAFEALLPVLPSTQEKTLGLLLIIDASGSMEAEAYSGMTRIDLAKEAAKACLNALSPDDYIGVMAFNETVTLRPADLIPVTRREEVIRDIESIRTHTGTKYTAPIREAGMLLSGFNKTDIKHVIFLSDGEPTDGDLTNMKETVSSMSQSGVTLSTIVLGTDSAAAVQIAQEMATLGGGRFHNVLRANELEPIMVEETKTASVDHTNETAFTPRIVNNTPAVAGIGEMPALGGFYGAKLKEGATLILAHGSDPVYAEWTRGEGKVGSLLCDLNGTWSKNLFTDGAGLKFLFNSVNSLSRKNADLAQEEIEVSFVRDNFTVSVHAETDVRDGDVFLAELVLPGGNTQPLALSRLSASEYAASFSTEDAGIYTVRITRIRDGEEVTVSAHTAFSYSDEYAEFPDESECFALMEDLCAAGNGKLLFNAENLFGATNETVTGDFDPSLILLILSAVLFLLDIVVRKFKIKWLHESRKIKTADVR